MGKIRQRFFSGLFYTALAKYSGMIFSIVITSILARIISPSDFGIVAIATVFISFLSTLTSVGISPAIVQNKDIGSNDIESIFSLTIYLAFFFSLLFLSLTPIISLYYGKNVLLRNVLAILSVNIFFSIATITPNALFFKNYRFKFIAIRTIIIQLVVGIVSVFMALSAYGVYALVINPILTSFLIFILSYLYYPIKFHFYVKWVSINKILSFSIYQMLFNLVYLFYRNIDKLLVGRYLGMESLGYYEKSYRLMMLPLENINGIISPVLHPVLSEYQNDMSYIWDSYKKILRLLAEVGCLLTVLIYFLASPIILILYGKDWEPAIPVFQILSLSICVQVMQGPIGAILQTINKVKGLFYSSVWALLIIVIFILIGLTYKSVEVIAIGLVISFYLIFLIYQFYLTKYFQHSIMEILSILCRPFMYFVILFIGVWLILLLFENQNFIFRIFLVFSISSVYVFALSYYGKIIVFKYFFYSFKKR